MVGVQQRGGNKVTFKVARLLLFTCPLLSWKLEARSENMPAVRMSTKLEQKEAVRLPEGLLRTGKT